MTDGEIKQNLGNFFSPGQVATAAFLGGPVPGTILLAKNYLTLGKRSLAIRSALLGLIGTMVLFLFAAVLPAGFPNMALPLAYTIGLREVAKHLQGEDAARFESEGRKGSWLVTVALGLGFMAATLLIVLALSPFEQQ